MRSLKRKSIIFSWLVPFLFISLAALVINIVSYRNFDAAVIQKNNSYNLELLNNIKSSVDGIYQNAIGTIMRLTNNSVIHSAAEYTQINGECMETLLDIRTILNSELNSEMYIGNIYVYLHKSDYVIDIRSGNALDKYVEIYGSGIADGEGEVRELLRRKHYIDKYKGYEPEENLDGNVVIMNTVYGATFDNAVATIVVCIDYTKFMENNFLADTAGLYVLDSDNKLFISNNTSAYSALTELLENQKEKSDVMMNRKNVVISADSDVMNCRLYRVYDRNEYMGNILTNRTVMYMVFVIYTLLCGAFICYTVNRNYAPIKALVRNVEKYMGTTLEVDENEIKYIHSMLTEIIKKNNMAYDKLTSWSDVIKNSVWTKVFKNIRPQSSADMEIYKSCIELLEDKNYVLVACIPDVSEGVFNEEAQDEVGQEYWAKIIISNILDELISPRYSREFIEVEGILYIIAASSAENLSEYLCRIFEDFFVTIRQYFRFGTTFIISNEHKSIQLISLAYEEVIAGLNRRYIADNNIIKYSDLQARENSIYSFPLEKEMCLANSLSSMDYKKSITIINEIFEENIHNRQLSAQAAKCLMYMLTGTIINAINKCGSTQYGEFLEKHDIFDRLEKCNNVYKMRDEIEIIVKEFCETKVEDSADKIKELAKEIEEYIKSNYSDYSLSGARLESHFNLSYGYLSKIFKKYKATGLLNYITDVRMEKARNLLKTTDYTVSEISQMVGYSSARSFSRAFTKLNGIAPGKYRE